MTMSLLLVAATSQSQSGSVIESLKQNRDSVKTRLTPEQEAFKQAYQRELAEFTAKRLKAFAAFKAKYNASLAQYRQGILAKWGEVDVSDDKKVVHYDGDTKTLIDFEKEEVVVSIIHDEDAAPSKADAAKALDKVKQLSPKNGNAPQQKSEKVDVIEAYSGRDDIDTQALVDDAQVSVEKPKIDQQDIETERAFIDEQTTNDQHQVDRIVDNSDLDSDTIEKTKKEIKQHNQKIKQRNEKRIKQSSKDKDALVKKRITRYKIPLKPKSEQKKIASVLPLVTQFSETWGLPKSLVMAVIHTESSFNPLAESHIPAYGLMQVVPHSAGIDVNEFLFNKREPLYKDYLFNPEQNVEAGSAYLHLLDHRYLKKITDPQSRLYCVIAAYNTGVGNVARAFTKKPRSKMNDNVVSQINSLSAEQVLQILGKQLPYDETKRYLKKVKQRMEHYQQII